jgi:hypothetical protein
LLIRFSPYASRSWGQEESNRHNRSQNETWITKRFAAKSLQQYLSQKADALKLPAERKATVMRRQDPGFWLSIFWAAPLFPPAKSTSSAAPRAEGRREKDAAQQK